MPEPLDLSAWARRDEAAREARRALLARVQERLPEVRALFAEVGVAEAYLFGSLAQGVARVGSDVDVAVAGCPATEFYRLASRLERTLELPLDLVDLDRAPADFAALIRSSGKRLYPNDVAP